MSGSTLGVMEGNNFMYAVEFESVISDEGFIAVPREYTARIGKNVKVILLEANNEELPSFSSVRIKTKGFKFDRTVANER